MELAYDLPLQVALLGGQEGWAWRGQPGRDHLILLPLVGVEEAWVEQLGQLVAVAGVLLL